MVGAWNFEIYRGFAYIDPVPCELQIKISRFARGLVEICSHLKSPKYGAPSICGSLVFL